MIGKQFAWPSMPPWVREIIEQTAAKHRVKPHLILVRCRQVKVCLARWEAMYLVKSEKPHLSGPQIGKWFNRNHTVVLYGATRHAELNDLPRHYAYSIVKRVKSGRSVGRPRKS